MNEINDNVVQSKKESLASQHIKRAREFKALRVHTTDL